VLLLTLVAHQLITVAAVADHVTTVPRAQAVLVVVGADIRLTRLVMELLILVAVEADSGQTTLLVPITAVQVS
jgi:hypothetical protein